METIIVAHQSVSIVAAAVASHFFPVLVLHTARCFQDTGYRIQVCPNGGLPDPI